MAEKRPSLNVLSGPLSGRKLVLEDAVDNILIGSDASCGFVLDTPGVSPIHARLWVDLNGATVYDTNSPTGVYVNDDRVVKEAPVRNGDILWLGPPGEEGSVLIQCILPPPPPPAAEGASPEEEAATPPPIPARDGTAPIEMDSGATMAFGIPAFLPDEPEKEATPSAADVAADRSAEADAEASDVDSTVVMTTSDLMGPGEAEVVEEVPETQMAELDDPEPEATVRYTPTDATALLDVSEGLEIVDEPTVVLAPPVTSAPSAPPDVSEPSPVEHAGFPDFDVEPTVAMAPPPLPPRAATPPPPAPAEFEEDMEPTMVEAPAPPAARASAPAPAPAKPATPPPAINEDEDDAATVMFKRADAPVRPVPKPPSIPPPPVRPSPPAAAAPVAPARPPAEARPPAAKAPAAARPAAPPPRARTERPAPVAVPAAAAAPAAARRGGSSKAPLIAGAGVVVVALAFAAYWFTRPASTPTAEASPIAPPPVSEATPVAAAPPVTQAAAPPPETLLAAPAAVPSPIPEAVTVVRSPVPSPRVAAATPAVPPNVAGQRPGATPPGQKPPTAAPATPPPAAAPSAAQQAAAAVANLMSQAKTASDARNYDAAVSMYDEVLKLDPHNGAATAGRTAALAARNAPRKTFVAGRTSVQTDQKSKGGLSGFDGADVVQKSADFSGRLEFAMNPATVKPGEPYRLTVALVNDGKKAIKISGMTYTVTVNGQKSGNPIMPKVREVGPAQRVVLEELPGVFPEASSWVAEVLVTANKGDSLKNQLTWK